MEASPSGLCNHRCTFCALDFMEYKKRFLNTEIFTQRLTEMEKLGLKSIMYAGEGEPLLHKDIAQIITQTKKAHIDAAMTTNGVLFKKKLAEKILGNMEWIKVSINAGRADTYADIHRTKSADFNKVLQNMENAAKIRSKYNYACTLGMQMLLLPENVDEAVELANSARNIGMDYLVIKPYSQHLLSKTTKYSDIKYSAYQHLAEKLSQYNTDNFHVVFRLRTMKKWDDSSRNYKRCLALPFWSYLDAGGNVWGCSLYLEDDRFLYGNINDSSFKSIWEGEKRLQSLKWVDEHLDPESCRVNCRMDEVNRFLTDLKNPPQHINFI